MDELQHLHQRLFFWVLLHIKVSSTLSQLVFVASHTCTPPPPPRPPVFVRDPRLVPIVMLMTCLLPFGGGPPSIKAAARLSSPPPRFYLGSGLDFRSQPAEGPEDPREVWGCSGDQPLTAAQVTRAESVLQDGPGGTRKPAWEPFPGSDVSRVQRKASSLGRL